MTHHSSLHPVQASILRKLRRFPGARFSQLNDGELTNDHFSFHINQLVREQFIVKTEMGDYQLTSKGKQTATVLQDDTGEFMPQGRVAVLLICQNKEGKLLVQKRQHHPHWGAFGFVVGLVPEGETVETIAKYIGEKEIGNVEKMRKVGIYHNIERDVLNNHIEDKYYFIFKATITQKIPLQDPSYRWMTKEEIADLPEKLIGIDIGLHFLSKNKFSFVETVYGKK